MVLVCALGLGLFAPTSSVALDDGFDAAGCIEETGSMSESSDPEWWVSSGGRFCRQGSLGSTVLGSLPLNDRWRTLYASSNPLDTDNGFHPQNIFRFVTKDLWKDVQQTAYFRIRALNMSASPNRNASNGILFFHRYQDGMSLYYAGVRVDGAAVIKKKLAGTYYTMAYRSGVYPGGSYNALTNPNLLPTDRWVGMRTVVEDVAGGVTLRVELDDPTMGSGWTPILEAEDSGQYGGPAITVTGHAGIRTDFMDVEFQGYEAVDLANGTPTPTCSYSVSPSNQTLGSSGGAGSSSVQTEAGCPWTATSNASWLVVTSGANGVGEGSVRYAAEANPTKHARSAVISVGGEQINVTQAKGR